MEIYKRALHKYVVHKLMLIDFDRISKSEDIEECNEVRTTIFFTYKIKRFFFRYALRYKKSIYIRTFFLLFIKPPETIQEAIFIHRSADDVVNGHALAKVLFDDQVVLLSFFRLTVVRCCFLFSKEHHLFFMVIMESKSKSMSRI